MCGIVGMAGNLNYAHTNMLHDMLLLDTVRGQDSTGLFTKGFVANAKPKLVKAVGLPDALLWEDEDYMFSQTTGKVNVCLKVAIGHNRAATVGKITKETAHPFWFGNIIGVHNGTLTSWEKEFAVEGQEFLTDSQAIIFNIHKNGIDDVWSKLRGAAALVWWNEEDETINMIRNAQRPLYFAQGKDDKSIYWASEPWIMTVAASRNRVDLMKDVDKDGKETSVTKMTKIEENTLYTFKITGNDYTAVEPRKIEPFRPLVTTQNWWGEYGYGSSYPGFGNWQKKARGASQNYTGISKAKDYKTVNANWTEGFDKADKDTRNMLIKLVGCGSTESSGVLLEEYITAEPLDHPGMIIKVMTTSRKNYLDLVKYIGEDVVFKTLARMRVRAIGKSYEYKISGASIEIHKMPEKKEADVVTLHPNLPPLKLPPPAPKDDEEFLQQVTNEELLPKKTSGKTDWVPASDWEKTVSDVGGCCLTCGNPFDKHDAPTMYWVNDDFPICHVCEEDPYILTYLNSNGAKRVIN